jgi:hypothetical protein
MKKINGTFNLPVQVFFTGQGFQVKTSPTDSPELETDCPVNAWAASHAINNVDALADALESIINASQLYMEDWSILDDAKAALAAYRGEA